MDLQQIFINNLKFFRKKKGLTQNDLTLALDKGYNYINGIEQRKGFPPPAVIEQIAEILEIRPSQLFDENSCVQNLKSSNDFAASLANEIYLRLRVDIKNDIKIEIEKIFND